jgi:hypothetical protein
MAHQPLTPPRGTARPALSMSRRGRFDTPVCHTSGEAWVCGVPDAAAALLRGPARRSRPPVLVVAMEQLAGDLGPRPLSATGQ